MSSLHNMPREAMVAQFVLELRQLDEQGMQHWVGECENQWRSVLTPDEFKAAWLRYVTQPSCEVRGIPDVAAYRAGAHE